jgi:hypothetical protein
MKTCPQRQSLCIDLKLGAPKYKAGLQTTQLQHSVKCNLSDVHDLMMLKSVGSL